MHKNKKNTNKIHIVATLQQQYTEIRSQFEKERSEWSFNEEKQKREIEGLQRQLTQLRGNLNDRVIIFKSFNLRFCAFHFFFFVVCNKSGFL